MMTLRCGNWRRRRFLLMPHLLAETPRTTCWFRLVPAVIGSGRTRAGELRTAGLQRLSATTRRRPGTPFEHCRIWRGRLSLCGQALDGNSAVPALGAFCGELPSRLERHDIRK